MVFWKFNTNRTALTGAFVLLFFACTAGGLSKESGRPGELRISETASLDEAFLRAERYISLGQFSEAHVIVQSVIHEHPNTVYADKAYFMKGAIYVNMLNFNRDADKAAAAFRMVIASEPETEFDVKAREMLERLKGL